MMTRGEVALIVAQKGLSAGLLSSAYFTSVILLILVSSIATPLLLGAIYARWPDLDVPAEPAPAPAPAKPTA
jgi:Kef-type K+ transport system membrane component KefB